MAGLKVECPKCGGQAWFREEGPDLWLRCMCGLLKLVKTKLATAEIERIDGGPEVTLPRAPSKLFDALAAMALYGEASTQAVTEAVNAMRGDRQSSGDVSGQLTVLRYKGLVEVVTQRRGLPGGSLWRLTAAALAAGLL